MRVAHISDLHFGAELPDVVAALAADLREQAPDLVIVSGDLTMRARRAQFRAARAFLDGLGLPWFSVPGNHDLPLYRVAARLFWPLAAYRRWIGEPEPSLTTGELFVHGISSSRRYLSKGGRVDRQQLARIGDAPRVRWKALVLHHPAAARRAAHAVSAAGFDLILCGHDHVARQEAAGPGLQLLIAGTATSWRVRAGEPQSYNLLTLGDAIEVRVRRWDGVRFAGPAGE